MMNFLFSGKGRVGRKGIWLFFIAYWVIHTAAHVADHTLGWTKAMDDPGPLMTIFTVLAIWPAVAVEAKRYHDRGMSGWWVLGFIVLTAIPLCAFLYTNRDVLAGLERGSHDLPAFSPIGYALIGAAALIQLVRLVILLFLPGQAGDNRYGRNPRKR